MSVLSGKKILLGVTAGIAAYKAAFLVRLLVKKGADVRVVMTPAAKDFVTPLTLSTLSNNEVWSDFVSEEREGATWNNHVELGLWADLFVIAPATANTLSKMAQGTSDNLLLATYLSAKCPVYYAPAMDLDMYAHPSTQHSFETLTSFGNIQIPAEEGALASGLVGKGRMAEPENIVSFLETDLRSKLPLRDKKILVTAGPTYEAIDPVRFIGNHSSGKMGYAIASKAATLGADVVLVSGPTTLELNHDHITVVRVVSAAEMYSAVHDHKTNCDIAILSAAVADFRPKQVASEKIKKKASGMSLELERTQDILASLGAEKENMILVGFAMETENALENAKSKLKKKNLDLIVLNSLKDEGAGFQGDTNKITLIDYHNNVVSFEVKPKAEVANDIFKYILDQFYA
ncbi:bifunctional phosphopantothenoylcysteine decarboxylase/phosphopantothenate--cysteine ligase CoaBC [Altibacter sp. HG106]|uniref:bifunctional phosphopantothenoylcysteine decarboxylase/phosphopantothenate--cysteine ligase CoaBC n=1 Tax=Altibacter sp. HG106 TaxID=3023937 RepID=UPI00235059AE|nr:bifunctional phosphopantothenoylcysteine decarboxylase/phosphopantothenate--cysteine ligase CoaBC [Altibacter sp. HG106]MDC7995586.1 bifunctional phosphopantothenoylcysteine decarboxylase/phosphopantothenate--cysteine ligase CoaBC [Altibacter sp. HG106]